MSVEQYTTLLSGTISEVGALGGVSLLPTPFNNAKKALLAALPTGSRWLRVAELYDPTAQTWTCIKTGQVFHLISGIMPVVRTDGPNGLKYIQFGSSAATSGVFMSEDPIWLANADQTLMSIMASATGANGALIGQNRTATSQTGGVTTGGSYGLAWTSTDSVLAMNERTATASAQLQTLTGAASGTDWHAWAMARKITGNIGKIRKDGTYVREITNATRASETANMLIGAAGWSGSGTTFERPLRNAKVSDILYVPGADYESANDNWREAFEVYANLSAGIVIAA